MPLTLPPETNAAVDKLVREYRLKDPRPYANSAEAVYRSLKLQITVHEIRLRRERGFTAAQELAAKLKALSGKALDADTAAEVESLTDALHGVVKAEAEQVALERGRAPFESLDDALAAL